MRRGRERKEKVESEFEYISLRKTIKFHEKKTLNQQKKTVDEMTLLEIKI